jgi:hypothetical protein
MTSLPPEAYQELLEIKRRRDIANALLANSMTPIQARPAGRMIAPPHWLEGVAKMAQAYVGSKSLDEADERAVQLARTMATQRQEAFDNLQRQLMAALQPSQTPSMPAAPPAAAQSTAQAQPPQNIEPSVEPPMPAAPMPAAPKPDVPQPAAQQPLTPAQRIASIALAASSNPLTQHTAPLFRTMLNQALDPHRVGANQMLVDPLTGAVIPGPPKPETPQIKVLNGTIVRILQDGTVETLYNAPEPPPKEKVLMVPPGRAVVSLTHGEEPKVLYQAPPAAGTSAKVDQNEKSNRDTANKLYKQYSDNPIVKDYVKSTPQVMQMAQYIAQRNKMTEDEKSTNDRALANLFLSLTKTWEGRATNMFLKQEAGLEGIPERLLLAAQNAIRGYRLNDDMASAMWNFVQKRYSILGQYANRARDEVLSRAKAMNVPPEMIFKQ